MQFRIGSRKKYQEKSESRLDFSKKNAASNFTLSHTEEIKIIK